MKKIVFLVLFAATVIAASPDAFAACQAAGVWNGGPYSPAYNHIANGAPPASEQYDRCWNPFNAFYTSTAPSPWGYIKAYEFNYAGSITQEFQVPAHLTGTSWQLRWMMEFNDPNNDATWNRFSIEVRNVTKSTTLFTYTFNGGQGDQYWQSHAIDFTGNYTGDTIRVRIKGSKAYSNTIIRVAGISLWQE